MSRNRRNNKIPWKVSISRDFVVWLFLDTFLTKKCLETEKQPNLLKKTLFSRGLVVLHVYRHFFVRKVSRNSQTTKSLEIMTFQGILLFLLFLDTFHIQGDLSFPLLPDTSTEPSDAGARRGSSNWIFKQIQIHIFKYIQQQHDPFSRNTKIGNIQTIFGLIYSSHTCEFSCRFC